MWDLYRSHPSFVLGFHGCAQDIGEAVIRGEVTHLQESRNDHDWLGNGIYFWEGSPQRALEWATQRKKAKPFVVGAIIDLGFCCNLADRASLDELRQAYSQFKSLQAALGLKLPKNEGKPPDRLWRRRDRAVIEYMHQFREYGADLPRYDTVRSPFTEGKSLYPGAGFKSKNHIQIAVRSPSCIKGYFRPIAQRL